MKRETIISAQEAGDRLSGLGSEYLVVHNPEYIYPPFEMYPLAPPVESLDGRPPAAVVMDMDGTTTTTETLCIHSLETMVRRITGRHTADQWAGLDRKRDYPHIIGNSTTKHVEYLVKAYKEHITREDTASAFLNAAVWTLSRGKDETRKKEVLATLKALGWKSLVSESLFSSAAENGTCPDSKDLRDILRRYCRQLRIDSMQDTVRASIDIYYHRYHEVLSMISGGQGRSLSEELTGGRPLIEPMPGVCELLLLVRGELTGREDSLYTGLVRHYEKSVTPEQERKMRSRLDRLCGLFADSPAKTAVVTSSIRYEADTVLNEVFRILRKQASVIVGEKRAAEVFSTPSQCYDVLITASDSSEIRLKPHRDLYSVALHTIGIMPDDFSRVIGFEDSEPGTQAIRASGIGLCAAVPFSDTADHDLSAAVHVLKGGLPQAILEYGLFI